MAKRTRQPPHNPSPGKIGYGNPPKSTQFKKGKSGNPRGRPKGSTNFKADLVQTLQSTVKVNRNGRAQTVSTQRASLMVLREKALSGDQRAIQHLIALAVRLEDDLVSPGTTEVHPADRAILDDYFRERKAIEAEQLVSNVHGSNGATSVPPAEKEEPLK